jgi:hypothetical protein
VADEGACILDRYHMQKGLFGASGFTLKEGLTDTNQYELADKGAPAEMVDALRERGVEVTLV